MPFVFENSTKSREYLYIKKTGKYRKRVKCMETKLMTKEAIFEKVKNSVSKKSNTVKNTQDLEKLMNSFVEKDENLGKLMKSFVNEERELIDAVKYSKSGANDYGKNATNLYVEIKTVLGQLEDKIGKLDKEYAERNLVLNNPEAVHYTYLRISELQNRLSAINRRMNEFEEPKMMKKVFVKLFHPSAERARVLKLAHYTEEQEKALKEKQAYENLVNVERQESIANKRAYLNSNKRTLDSLRLSIEEILSIMYAKRSDEV